MPSFRSGAVATVLETRPGLQRVLVELGTDLPERAYVLTKLTGPVAVGDRVLLNTTAVELGLGTGGWHVVHWNLERTEWHDQGPGHVLKVRYTSLQTDVGSTEEHEQSLADVTSIDGMPVVAAALHSQLPAIAVALKLERPDLRVAYVMTDGAGLPIAVSDLVAALTARTLIDVTITSGQAFGGDYEAVSVYSALAIARHVAAADVAIVVMGPGITGTETRLGFSGIELGPILDAVSGLGGVPIACLRASLADRRERHRGVSHHSLTALTTACRSRVLVALPAVGGAAEARLRADLSEAGIAARHEIVAIVPPDVLDLFARHDLDVLSMGRPAAVDPILFQSAAAAGTLAARRVAARATVPRTAS
jgi:Protein of unknown function (DUF3866)